MNILLFGETAWDDRNSFGNTVSNIFCGDAWKNDNFYNFYARQQLPNNENYVTYYNLSAIDILKGILKLNISGKVFSGIYHGKEDAEYIKKHKVEQDRINKLHKKNNNFVYFCHELIWLSRIWINKPFKKFIKDANPDILFSFVGNLYILWPLIKYLKKNTKCKIVLFNSDDVNYGYDKLPFYRRWYLKKYFIKCIESADKLYGASDKMNDLFKERYGKEAPALYKGCTLSEKKTKLNKPLRFVYAGNLLWGRDEILGQIAQILDDLNKKELLATLEIYTGTTITKELDKKLNIGKSSKIMGQKSYDEIKEIMASSDVVLDVESFDEDTTKTVMYSLSTKIIDCMQCGAQILAIGPKNIASMEYLNRVDGAIVVDNMNDAKIEIENLVNNPNQILDNSMKTREFANKYHRLNTVQENLHKEFVELAG